MGAILEFIAELLNTFLPEPWNERTAQCLLLLAVLTIVYVIVKRFYLRKKVSIKVFLTSPDQQHLNNIKIGKELATNIKRIQHIHSADTITSAGYITSLVDPMPMNEGLANSFDTLIAAAATINPATDLILYLIDKIWPTLQIEGNLHFSDDDINFGVHIKKGNKQVGYCMEAGKLDHPGSMSEIIDVLTYKILLEFSNRSLISSNFSIGTKSWKSFKSYTEALNFWQSPTFDIHKDEDIHAIDTMLAESIHHDPDYAIAYYNRGTLSYLTYKDVGSNELARHCFQEAIERVHNTQSHRGTSGQMGNRRIEGLALLGLSRCYSQLRHRYGYLDSAIVDKARESAQRAIKLVGRTAQSLYTLAFAYHCTETLDDIRKARRSYEQIIKKEPNKHPTVHNNLGYILMVGGRLLMEAGRTSETEKWYNTAQHHMELVFKTERASSRAIDFSLANLGNLYRLRGNYQRAIESYHKALHSDPEHSTYTNGLNELSLVYFEMGDISKAMYYHRLALGSTQDRSHLQKLLHQVVDTLLKNSPAVGNSLKSLYNRVSNTDNVLDLGTWETEVEALLKPNCPGSIPSVAVPSSSGLLEYNSDTESLIAALDSPRGYHEGRCNEVSWG